MPPPAGTVTLRSLKVGVAAVSSNSIPGKTSRGCQGGEGEASRVGDSSDIIATDLASEIPDGKAEGASAVIGFAESQEEDAKDYCGISGIVSMNQLPVSRYIHFDRKSAWGSNTRTKYTPCSVT